MSLRSRRYGFYVLGLLAAVNLLNYANRNVVFHKRMYDDLRVAFSFSNAELGLLGTAFMVTHALVTLPIGWIGDRFDRRRVMAAGLFVWSAAALAAASASGLGGLLAARAVQGIGCAACVPVANALLCEVFPPDDKARTVSVFNLGLFVGGVAGFVIGALFGFPLGLVVVGLPGFALALLVLRLELPPQPRRLTRPGRLGIASFFRDAGSILRVGPLRWMFAGAVLMAFAAGGYLAWFTELLEGAKKLDRLQALVVLGVALAGGLGGVVTGGVVGDRLRRRLPYGRQLAVSTGFLAAVPCAVLAIELDPGPLFYLSACLLLFFVSWYHGPLAASVDDLAPPGTASTAQGTYIFLMHLFGTAPSSWAVGVLADEVGVSRALYAPTGAMLLAAGAFLLACRGVRSAAVLQRPDV